MELLVINRYTCPRLLTVQVQAILLCVEDMDIIKTFPRMTADNEYLELFSGYKKVIICDVPKASMLDSLTILNKE